MRLFSLYFLSVWFLFCSFSYRHVETHAHSIHILEIDPSLYEINLTRALDLGLGRETVISLAERKGAISGINGGFFAIGGTYDGVPCGILKIDQNWYGLPKKARGAIGWKKGGSLFLFDRVLTEATVEIEGRKMRVDGLNEPRGDNQVVLFSSAFGFTTLTRPGGKEILIVEGEVQETDEKGSLKLPQNGWVLSIGKNRLSEFPKDFKSAKIEITILPQEFTKDLLDAWNQMDYIVGGSPLLIYNGKKLEDFSGEKVTEKFLHEPHARSAVGILPNRHWVFVTVDKAPHSGMTIPELASFMEELGSIFALNLDGGGSSTLVLENRIVNEPTPDEDDKEKVRRVSDAILIKKRTTLN